jgi:hypothetical protein
MSTILTNLPEHGILQDIPGLAASAIFLHESLGITEPELRFEVSGAPGESGALLRLHANAQGALQFGTAHPVYLWVFALPNSDDAGTMVFAKSEHGFAFKDAYALNAATTNGSQLGQEAFWASSWVLFCDQESYLLPRQVVDVMDSDSASSRTYTDKQILVTAGLNILHRWKLQDALQLFALGPFARLVGDQELLLLANEQPSGMLFTLLLENVSSPLDDYLHRFLQPSSVSFSVFHSFESETFATTYATLSAQVTCLGQPCILETTIPAIADPTGTLSLEIYPQTPIPLTKQEGQEEGWSSLLPELGIDLHVPPVFPTLDLAIGYIRIYLGDNAIQRVSLELQLHLGEGDDDPGFEVIPDLFTLYGVSLEVDWLKESGVSFVVAGAMNALSYDFLLSFAYPSMVIKGDLAPDQATEKSIEALAREVGFPEQVGAGLAAVGTVFDISMFADVDDELLEITLQNHTQWQLLDFVELDSIELRLLFHNNWGFSGAALTTELLLPIGEQSPEASELDSVVIAIDAEFDNDEKLWTFVGETGRGQQITVGEAIEGLVQKLDGAAPAQQLPEALETLAVRNISLYIDSQGNADIACETVLDVEDQEVDFWVHLKRSEQDGLQLAGSLFINGIQLAAAFSSVTADAAKGSDKYLLGSLQTPLKLDSTDLMRAIAPSLADDVPITVDIELLGLLLALHSGSEAGAQAQREYLFRLSFNIDVGLDGLPLIGHMLEDVRFKDGQLLAANRDWQNQHIDDVNALLGAIEPPPPAIAAPQQANATVAVGKGITLSGTFQIAEGVGFPLFLQFGGAKQQEQLSAPADDKQPAATADAAPVSGGIAEGQSDARSQSKIDKVIGAVRIKKVALIFENGRIGLQITGGLALAAFEFELMGMQVTVPQSVLDDPSQLSEIVFALDGFGVEIHKGTLAIMGAFLRQHHEERDENGGLIAYDEFSGIVQVAFPPLNLTGMGSYAMYHGHPSLFLFVALGYPIPVHPSLLIEGMALGFGIHRDFIPPQPQEILTYPLVAVAVTPPPAIDIQQMADAMHKYFPPAADLYFVVVGVKFKAFGLVDSLVMAAVKFGRSLEINLIGVSSILFPSAFIELAWTARFVPESGYLFIGGQLTDRSYLLVPQVQLTGGFAVAAWLAGEHKGDFVVSVGGYHPQYHVPDHYPNHIPRLGISFHLGPADIKGAMYFAITPQCVMMGGSLEINVKQGSLSAFIKLSLDAIIFFEPFHYDVLIGADVGVKVDVPLALTTLHIDLHLHVDVHIWGPEFSGVASLDVGPKTFDVAIGAAAEVKALPLSYEKFKEKFLPTVCTISVTQGLLRKAQEGGVAIYVVDAKQVVLEARSTVPITKGDDGRLGITPMDVRGAGFKSEYTLRGADRFKSAEIEDAVPAGIWGGVGLQAPDLTDPSGGLVRDVLTGYRLTPGAERVTLASDPIEKEKLAYNTDIFTLKDREVGGAVDVQGAPNEMYFDFTGLHISDVSPLDGRELLQAPLLTYALS